MPKIGFDFFKKVRLAFWFITKQKGWGLYAECGVCKGIKVTRVEHSSIGMTYEAKYECLDCGATAEIKELWKNKGDK